MAGLGFAVKLAGGTPFLGREALEAARARPLPRLLVGFAVDDPAVTLLGRETIYRDGRRVGWLASGGWGYTVGRGFGYGYVRDEAGVSADDVLAGDYELEVGAERVPAEPFLRPPYDPESARVRG
jgi:4-methylaminobutanoate oxidase (formaldehyde-forming)